MQPFLLAQFSGLNNELLVLNLIRTRQRISPADTARSTGLNESPIPSIAPAFPDEGPIYEAEMRDSSASRRPQNLRIKSEHCSCPGLMGAISLVISRRSVLGRNGMAGAAA